MVVFIIILCLSSKLHFFNYPQTSSLSLKVEAQEAEEMQTHAREAKVAFRARPLAGLLPEGHLKLSLGRPEQAPENPNDQGMPTKSPPSVRYQDSDRKSISLAYLCSFWKDVAS